MRLFDLSDKVAIVTGGNGGIGLGMAKGLAEAGAKIAVIGRNTEKNASAVNAIQNLGAKALAVETDVRDSNAVTNMVEAVVAEWGRVNILINNAGINIRKRPEDLSEEEWRQVLDTNLTSAFLCSKACYPEMKKAGGGKILNNGSMLSLFGSPWGSAYGSSKGGIMQMTKSHATSWADDNIQVNCYLPGWINTDLTLQAREDVPGLHEKVLARTPAGRWGEPADLAGLAVYLASPASDFLTGTAIPIDGGFSIAI
ncbi:MAG: glucose 1-dehydrogenase [Pseudomonadota bacterium]|nr:glucose 1-dehydrogenase [Pseudomonadota bacterium]|tara:strand:+ start:127 stop:891 length:765 start_codon:yes stop_codon:yes gene_type:complete